MIKYIIEQELYDKEFVDNYTTGLDHLKWHVAKYTPQLVEEITWIPQEKMEKAAELYATTKPSAIHWGVGLEQNINCIGTDAALMYLVVLTGNLDVPGGNVLFDLPPVVGYKDFGLPEKLSEEQRLKRIGGQEYKMLDLVGRCPPYAVWDAIVEGKPYKVRALYVAGSNPLVVRENTWRVREALEKVEFMVVSDMFLTPTAEYADIVLPVASWLEYNTVGDYWKSHGYVFPRRKIVENPNCWSDLEIFNELGKRLYPEYFWDEPDQALNFILKPSGLTWEEFCKKGYLRGPIEYRKYISRGFSTKSGKFEFYPTKFKEWGLGPLPDYQENPETPLSAPSLAERYPYILITGGRSIEYFNSEGRQLKTLRRSHPDPIVEINPVTAKKHGVVDGDWVVVENQRGSVRMKAKVTDGIDPRVIHAEHGWWFPEIETPDHGYQISNINLLTDDRPPVDPLMGSTRLKSLLCNIRRA
jgi:anaerobic selenocysteine-containing dehydrogenase